VRAIILYDDIGGNAEADERDTLDQVREVKRNLSALGYRVELLSFGVDVRGLRDLLKRKRPDLVFNLIETRSGEGSSISMIPTLLDDLRIPYTGCPSESLYVTSNKLVAKQLMKLAGIPTPEWMTPRDISGTKRGAFPLTVRPGSAFIIKSVWEHASIGIDQRSIVYPKGSKELQLLLARRIQNGTGLFFAERYIEGREFNLSLIEVDDEVCVLPPAEMKFFESGGGGLKILSYRAKWDGGSSEYGKSQRCFRFDETDGQVLDQLKGLALRSWECFGLTGYARVDFRVDGEKIFVLEINSNPCIAPDSGFVAAAEEAGIGYREMVRHIADHPVSFY